MLSLFEMTANDQKGEAVNCWRNRMAFALSCLPSTNFSSAISTYKLWRTSCLHLYCALGCQVSIIVVSRWFSLVCFESQIRILAHWSCLHTNLGGVVFCMNTTKLSHTVLWALRTYSSSRGTSCQYFLQNFHMFWLLFSNLVCLLSQPGNALSGVCRVDIPT